MTFRKGSTLNWNILIDNNAIYCNQTMTENRKRSRDDDTCEFMPLSKRINNLHINNNNTVTQVPESSEINGINKDNVSSPSSSSDTEPRPNYDPGINSSHSSYYYENKLLFELHLERIQRTGQQYPF